MSNLEKRLANFGVRISGKTERRFVEKHEEEIKEMLFVYNQTSALFKIAVVNGANEISISSKREFMGTPKHTLVFSCKKWILLKYYHTLVLYKCE